MNQSKTMSYSISLQMINKNAIISCQKNVSKQFHYDYIKNKYGNNSKLLFADTDSLMYETKNGDVYEIFSRDKELFDFSNYSPDSKCHDDSKKIVVGKMKDETAGVAVK